MKVPTLFACLLFLQAVCFSATIYVPDDHATIQDAIDAVADGDTVIVRPGTYVEQIDFLGKAITVQSEQGADVTIIDGNQTGSVVTFQSGEDLTSILDSFTIRNGTGTFYATNSWYEGGGIYLLNSSATISGCTIKDNNTDHGGGIGTRNSSPDVTDCLFLDNTAVYGGGGMGLYEYSMGQITSSTFQGNSSYGSFDGGGGIYCQYSTPTIDSCSFTANDASGGGAINLCWYSNPTITGCSIVGNSAFRNGGIGCERSSPLITECQVTGNVAGLGGGIAMDIDSRPVIIGNTISSNIAETGSGGGIYCQSPPQEITNNLIEENYAYEYGGGIYWRCSTFDTTPISGNTIRGNSVSWNDGCGGGVFFWDIFGEYVAIEDNRIEENSAESGGGIYFSSGDPRLLRNLFLRNRAKDKGGGMYNSSIEPVIINCVISQNKATDGGGIYCKSSTDYTNCTVADNQATRGAGLYCGINVIGQSTLVNCILWNIPDTPGSEIHVEYNDPVITYSNVRGGWPGTGNIDSDPLFAAQEERDYHLTYGSPCREAGDNTAPDLPSEDFEGDPRIAETTVDMGFDEFHGHLYHTGIVTPGASIKIKVVGAPGTFPVCLGLGAGLIDPPQQTWFGLLYLAPPIQGFNLGVIPGNGFLSTPVMVPSSWLAGEERPLQSLLGPPAPGSQLTNLHVLQVE